MYPAVSVPRSLEVHDNSYRIFVELIREKSELLTELSELKKMSLRVCLGMFKGMQFFGF